MNKNQFNSSLSRTSTHMQTVSSRVSFDADLQHSDDWERAKWGRTSSITEIEGPTEPSGDGITLPFSREDRGKEEIRDALIDISSFQHPEKERIYRHAKEFYTEEYRELNSADAVDIIQILKYAEENEHEDWLGPLEEQIETFFDSIEENPLYLSQADEAEVEDLGAGEIRELVQEREQSMREATEAVYGPSEENPNNRVINNAQKSYLWVLLKSSDEVNNLLPE